MINVRIGLYSLCLKVTVSLQISFGKDTLEALLFIYIEVDQLCWFSFFVEFVGVTLVNRIMQVL